MKVQKIVRLPALLKKLRTDTTELQNRVETIAISQKHQDNATEELKKLMEDVSHKLNKVMQRSSELEHMLTVASQKTTPVKQLTQDVGRVRFADNHLQDELYIELENNFRGTESEIKKRQEPYLKLFQNSGVDYKTHPAADLGSGRGEFVDLLHSNDIHAIGVDLNDAMVRRMQKKGLEAVHSDAIEYLMKAKSNSLGAVVGFHIAEHIPFDQLTVLVAEAQRTLVKGGFLLLETPNPENLTVGSFTFHYDPSHLKPIPPAILDFVAKYKGFEKVEIMRLQPALSESEIKSATTNKKLQDVLKLLYGPRDYALLAYK